ncbi:MAG: hypothetical protein Q9M50_09450 [Methylococcales bacterium]|nr:hypothetical protein [Methylococcales bacterium]
MKKLLLVATVATLALAGQASASVVGAGSRLMIDTFDTPALPSVEVYRVGVGNQNAGGTTQATPSDQIIGDYRTTDTNYVSGNLGGNTAVVAGVFAYSSDSGTKIRSSVTWDANGAGLGGKNLLQGVSDVSKGAFTFDILSIDQGEVILGLVLRDTFGQTTTVSGNNLIQGDDQRVSFSSFSNAAFNWGSVDSIQLNVTQSANAVDLTLDNIGVVTPIPAAIWLFGSGLGLIGLSKKRKKGQALVAA